MKSDFLRFVRSDDGFARSVLHLVLAKDGTSFAAEIALLQHFSYPTEVLSIRSCWGPHLSAALEVNLSSRLVLQLHSSNIPINLNYLCGEPKLVAVTPKLQVLAFNQPDGASCHETGSILCVAGRGRLNFPSTTCHLLHHHAGSMVEICLGAHLPLCDNGCLRRRWKENIVECSHAASLITNSNIASHILWTRWRSWQPPTTTKWWRSSSVLNELRFPCLGSLGAS
mmetsp:Transcript_12255/g.28601  ORF Transcript_12255/g.28601 Transcript_12255/m.28601 type:complete len:226 (-) Transcript_12255:134-811(-)